MYTARIEDADDLSCSLPSFDITELSTKLLFKYKFIHLQLEFQGIPVKRSTVFLWNHKRELFIDRQESKSCVMCLSLDLLHAICFLCNYKSIRCHMEGQTKL